MIAEAPDQAQRETPIAQPFLRNSWYVFGWEHELQGSRPLGRVIIGEPIVVWRDGEQVLHAMQDRCPHRHAPLSFGVVEGTTIRCMYHGMKFSGAGRCIHVPGMGTPPDVKVRTFPIIAKDGWLWIWTGARENVDRALIPDAFGVGNSSAPMRTGAIEYQANYQLLHDNLCDLSHLDYVHATTLGQATGARWSETSPRVTKHGKALRFERWFEDVIVPNIPGQHFDVWYSYDFAVPGVFIMNGRRFPAGTAARCENRRPPETLVCLGQTIEQQAVTPVDADRTAYYFATGFTGPTESATLNIEDRMAVVQAAFDEDRQIIEAQQRIWDLTRAQDEMIFLPQDKGPFLMRQMMSRLIAAENS